MNLAAKHNLTSGHVACGVGGDRLGFQAAGFGPAGAVDKDPAVAADYEYLTGEPCSVADLAVIQPDEFARLFRCRPDVLVMSPPCQGNSGCLPLRIARKAKYQELNALGLRVVWLALEAWRRPPPMLLFENVPRITSRSADLVRQIKALLHAYGYAVTDGYHCCGEIGGLAQRRRRYLLIARHIEQVPELVYHPPRQRVRGLDEVIGALPVPGPWAAGAGGPMHRLDRLSDMNWTRLALIRAGRDWRDLPAEVALPHRPSRLNGGYGVERWDGPGHAVLAAAEPSASWASVADPRLRHAPQRGTKGVKAWTDASATVIGEADRSHGPFTIADPRVNERHEGSLGVHAWDGTTPPVIGDLSIHNWPASVADPREAAYTHRVTTDADGRAWVIGPALNTESRREGLRVIRALDGTWHRPLTTLELAAIQGFPTWHHGDWLRFGGRSKARWRKRIGNAIPPPTAHAVALQVAETFDHALSGGGFRLSGLGRWVAPQRTMTAADAPLGSA